MLKASIKGHHRKGYRSRTGYRSPSYVDPYIRMIKDRGARGRGKKIIPIKKEGSLGGTGFFAKSRNVQEKILKGAVNKYGERSVASKLRAIQVFNKRTNPKLSKKARVLSTWVSKEYGGYSGEY